MAFDRNELRRVMGHFATGITVVTTHGPDGKRYGLTMNAVCSLSLTPPLMLICVDKRAESHPAFQPARGFVVNMLDESQEEVSRRFAVSGGEKFTGLACRDGVTGAPILEDALAWVECRVIEVHEGGDHTIYIGEVEDAGARTGDPILYYRGKYRFLRSE
jgi:flavin reductase (DIM6/NTAB) family NADH-FMN oxidoreductase RutF